jgi:glutamate-1-semialdehyde 2,1-aminomutase
MPKTGQELYQHARRRISGGTQLLSKRPEMLLPEQWPTYYSRAAGSAIWDLDGNRYIDMSYSGIGSCILGYADPDVDAAVRAAIDAGSMSTLNCAEEVELADLLCELHPWADMVRYARCGGEAMAVAVRIARAHTHKVKVAVCGYHGWHDWYLAANLESESALGHHLLPGLAPNGVPQQLAGTAFPFHYNRIDELEAIVQKHGNELAAIVMEPIRNLLPQAGFLEEVRRIATHNGCVLIFDEVTSAWRLNSGGAHLRYGVVPDVAVFAKAISNGYPMAAIVGTETVMQGAQESFISSTYWTERIGPTAALATIRKHQAQHVPVHLERIGKKVQACWQHAAEKTGLAISVSGLPQLAHFSIHGEHAQATRTLFTQRMLERGFLASNAFYANYAHSDGDVDAYAAAVKETFAELAHAIEAGTVKQLLQGPVAHVGFSRLT